MIKVNDLCFAYDSEEILSNVSFSIEDNEFVGIIGANGGGKSTTLKLLLGLLKPSKGSIEITTDKLSYVPQIAQINPSFPINVLDVVLMGTIHKYSFFFNTKEEKSRALALLDDLGLSGLANKKFASLSGGQKQRVLIARAMMSDSKILLLDEPTASIDAKGQIEVFELLKKLNQKGISIVCVCHDIALISTYANKLIHICRTCHIHKNTKGIDNNRLLHLAAHKNNLCEIDIWENYGISKL
ncbi:ATP-binding cassette domain-containing protein [Campylobacter sp. Cr9]|uniref:metal ABC transporter ATP-binding protein n=1 Tax=unclassified Campylobacter TaxID=2593542 RepID=UPI001EFB9659|nr:ATP-binding cassette domain-containing protein [Campylobacter sp. RM5004]MBZ7986117.1 ATP-binding cassette domain-containing protein [Campylobacter sp. Cr9]ULO02340.1 zinc ABC transporter, ATP-binding protein [Campylobacter sp. RM5004]